MGEKSIFFLKKNNLTRSYVHQRFYAYFYIDGANKTSK
ncbi:MAG: hypothetical protein ACFWTU_02255 [Leuconostoc mesenteroides]|nr:hypothetical protein C7M45_01837 [Leuconostoc mesenteroides]STY40068.1 Uncharacterised protein [Leuconostoc mesenteroides]